MFPYMRKTANNVKMGRDGNDIPCRVTRSETKEHVDFTSFGHSNGVNFLVTNFFFSLRRVKFENMLLWSSTTEKLLYGQLPTKIISQVT